MAENSNIDWTDDTLNYWIGCSEVRLVVRGADGAALSIPSECDNCYAKFLVYNRMGYRGERAGYPVLWGNPKTTPRHKTAYPQVKVPRWNQFAAQHGRRLVFTMSLSDVFEEHSQLNEWRRELWDLVEMNQHLDFQLLTKRPQNIRRMVPSNWLREWPGHVWVGTSAGTQAAMNRRAGYLSEIEAPVRFLSMEPLLELVDPTEAIVKHGCNWLIDGGESGDGKDRPRIDADTGWFRFVRDVAAGYGVPYFHKQSGGPRPGTGKELDGVLHHQFPDTGLGPVGGVRAQGVLV